MQAKTLSPLHLVHDWGGFRMSLFGSDFAAAVTFGGGRRHDEFLNFSAPA